MIDIYTVELKDLPYGLSEIPKPPKSMRARGTLPDQNLKLLTVVGSRKYSDYGKEVCEKIIGDLSGYPISIVSGLAMGIDAIAHKAAIKAKLHTIAIPGSGLSERVLYPRINFSLAEEILANKGLLLSEFEDDLKATMWTFPKRNRIMAGISHATLLIEAYEKSGTLITASLASDFNRELLIVPGSVFSPSSKGVHQFLKLGATLVTSSKDVLEALKIDTASEEISKKVIDDLSDDELLIYKRILHTPLTRDEIIDSCELEIEKIYSLLSLMEIKGLIEEKAGKFYTN